jgi:hypothetical protein
VPEEFEGRQVRCAGCGGAFTARSELNAPPERPSGAYGDRPESAPPRETGYPRSAPDDWSERRRSSAYDRDDRDRDPYDRGHSPQAFPAVGLTVTLTVALAVYMGVDLVAVVYNLVQLHNGDYGESEGIFANPMGCVQIVLLIPTAIIFACWMYQSYSNLHLLGVTGLQYTPGWAAGSFFVPILNIFRPCQIAQEIFRASNPNAPLDDRRAWKDHGGSPLIGLWWALWLVTGVLGQIAFRLGTNDMEEAGQVVGILGDGVSILAGLFAILMVQQIRSRQTAKYQRLREERPDRGYNPAY